MEPGYDFKVSKLRSDSQRHIHILVLVTSVNNSYSLKKKNNRSPFVGIPNNI